MTYAIEITAMLLNGVPVAYTGHLVDEDGVARFSSETHPTVEAAEEHVKSKAKLLGWTVVD